ncbi:MAG: hypothetical protein Q9205_005710 [Flavoplaca limonia]
MSEQNPHGDSEAVHRRHCNEEYHHETLRKIFALPPKLSLPTIASSSKRDEELSRTLSFRGYHSNQPAGGYLSQLKPDHAKIFCWKDCAVHGLYTDLPETGNGGPIRSYRLLDRGYRAWFPRRSTDRDISDGSFWGIFTWLRLRKDEMTGGKAGSEEKADVEARSEVTDELAQVWAFHEIFCEQLTKLAAEIEDSKAGRWELR